MRADDWASDIEQRERETAIAIARKCKPIEGNGICLDCLESVEVQRGNALRCISCQQDHELKHKQLTGGHRG
jgi:RNA polymerase-binding transcription factor DksA